MERDAAREARNRANRLAAEEIKRKEVEEFRQKQAKLSASQAKWSPGPKKAAKKQSSGFSIFTKKGEPPPGRTEFGYGCVHGFVLTSFCFVVIF